MTTTSDAWIEDWLSAGRFATYLQAAGGSRVRALELYEWNARLSAAFLRDISHLEVGLRNACDRQLQAATTGGDTHWTDPATLMRLFPAASRFDRAKGRRIDVNKNPRDKVERAREAGTASPGIAVPSPAPLPGKTIAELMFGFWTFLFADGHEKTLWVPYLHRAFPPGTDRSRLSQTLTAIREFRNRIAHHENILKGSEIERRRIVSATQMLSPELAAHCQATSEVSAILSKRP
ncbi:hypothetical protein ACIPY3_17485 [Paenarthrobacter sp. NPDC089714]|uniref:hypothetical protein n=1 Tax=Paenarthrobacter sp. NPDC089714 TaxID=3364377 RepID=UPI0038104544